MSARAPVLAIAIITCLVLTAARAGAAADTTGAVVHLVPPDSASGDVTTDNQQLGLFVHAHRAFDVCGVMFEADLAVADTIYARVYAASGTTRGALLAEGFLEATDLSQTTHFIPITAFLERCQDYDVAVSVKDVDAVPYWDESATSLPYDVQGLIRVRGGESGGASSSTELPHISLVGTSPVCSRSADLTPPDLPFWGSCTDGLGNRGAYVTAKRSLSVCSIGWDHESEFPGNLMTAKIYEANGTTRGPLIAQGGAVTTSTARQVWDIPIHAVLWEGRDYDIAVEWENFEVSCYTETAVTLPFTIGGAIEFRDGEANGFASNTFMARIVVGWEDIGGLGLQLVPPGAPAPSTSDKSTFDRGVFVEALVDQDVTSVGWYADVPEGATITARVYDASGTVRGSLIAEETILSGGQGMMWHDVPMPLEFTSGSGYDIEFSFSDANAWPFWNDSTGLPFTVAGALNVLDGESGGNASNTSLARFRVNACNDLVTGVSPGPSRVPGLHVRVPVPNPATATSVISYEVDRAGPVTVAVYDVRGRRVATLLESASHPAGPGSVTVLASDLASGVYFVRVETPRASVARKLHVVR